MSLFGLLFIVHLFNLGCKKAAKSLPQTWVGFWLVVLFLLLLLHLFHFCVNLRLYEDFLCVVDRIVFCPKRVLVPYISIVKSRSHDRHINLWVLLMKVNLQLCQLFERH